MQVPTSKLLSEYLLHTKDSTASNIALGKERMDYHYTYLLGEADNYIVERTKYSKLKADQRSFLLPPDYIKMKRVRVKIGGQWYLVTPTNNLDKWAYATELETTASIPVQWTVINEQGNMHIELSEIPNADSNVVNFEIVYEGYQDPLLFPDDYTTGTVSINQGQATVSASADVSFTDNMVSRFLKVTGGKFWYDIADVGTARTLSLVNYFQEADVNNTTYIIAECPRLPHEFHRTPLWGAVMEYYQPGNAKKAKDYEAWYARDIALLKNRYTSKTKGRVTPGIRVGIDPYYVPRNYPTSALRRI